jgi:hypothetical protein
VPSLPSWPGVAQPSTHQHGLQPNRRPENCHNCSLYVLLRQRNEKALARSAPQGRRRPAQLRRCEPIGQPRPGQKNQETRTGNPADRFVQGCPERLSPSAGTADGAIPTRWIGGWLAEHGDPTFPTPRSGEKKVGMGRPRRSAGLRNSTTTGELHQFEIRENRRSLAISWSSEQLAPGTTKPRTAC